MFGKDSIDVQIGVFRAASDERCVFNRYDNPDGKRVIAERFKDLNPDMTVDWMVT